MTQVADRRWREGSLWVVATAAVTAALLLDRDRVGQVHVAFAYLLLVLAASARCGRRVGLALAVACFFAFNFFFVPPFGTFRVHDPLDWLVLLAFLLTSSVAAQLLHRAHAAAERAERRAEELRRLAQLGGEALHAPRAEDAAAAIARVLREVAQVERCELYLRDPLTEHLRLVAQDSGGGEEVAPHTTSPPPTIHDLLIAADARTLLLPLRVRDRQVGLLVLRSDRVIPPDLAAQPFTLALAQYAALGVERIALTTAAAHAAALEAADQIKDAVLSAVSHDLRTPLTSIKATAREIFDSGDERGDLIEQQADRLNRYVTNLLDLSRLNAGALPVHLELVPAEEVLGALLQEVAPLAGSREIRVRLEGDAALLVGRMDLVLTLRALGNLVENALRHSVEGPVEICAEPDGRWVRFEVSDRGPGIPPAELDQVFEFFSQGSTARAGGAGLGLAISRRLVEAQGGSVTFTPRAGGGSCFTISLPLVDLALTAVAES